MSQPSTPHKPFVPENLQMKEFTLRAVLLGLVMPVVLGAVNAYLGLRAGVTIAATYPAAVIGMAVWRNWRGPLPREETSRTRGSVGRTRAGRATFSLAPLTKFIGLVRRGRILPSLL